MLFRPLKKFLENKNASMATQVVVFSVMLFGMSGVVLDFGRVYNEHSRMQSFTDQAALAAAGELRGDVGSIQRAIDAVFASDGTAKIQKGTGFSADAGEGDFFNVSHLFFLADMEDETGRQYDLGDDLVGYLYMATADGVRQGGDIAVASTQAKYVVAIGEERSVLNSLMQIINSTGKDSTVAASQKVRTISAAKHEKLTCGDFSNLVVCNPWENDQGASFQSVLNDPLNEGLQFKHTADGLMNPVTGAMTGPNSLARRIDLEGIQGVQDICRTSASSPPLTPGYDPTMTAAEIETLEAICFLAAATQAEYCVPEEIAITAATPEEITTSLNTAFDMWDHPIAEVLDWDRDADGDHSQDFPSTFNTGSEHAMRHSSPLFQPAINVMKGRIRDEFQYTTDAGTRPASSRLNYPRDNSDTGAFELIINSCIRPDHGLSGTNCFLDSEGNEFSYISQPTNYANVWEYYFTNFDAHFQATYLTPDAGLVPNFATASVLETRNWLNNTGADYTLWTGSTYEEADSLTKSGEDASLFINLPDPHPATAQLQYRRCRDASTGDPIYCGDPADPAAADPVPPLTDLARDVDDNYREPTFSNYTYSPWRKREADGTFSNLIDVADDRRRFVDVTVVNCGAAEVNGLGETMAEVVGFAQIYLLAPPRVTCPGGGEDCANDQISQADIYSEFVTISDSSQEHYAVLVR